MPLSYQRESINLGEDPQQFGHLVYTHAEYLSVDGKPVRVIFKKNKHGDPNLSRFEVAFSELARLFLQTDLTAKQQLVKDENNQVVGVACEHLSYVIEDREQLGRAFYQVEEGRLVPKIVNQTADIPFYFFNQFKPGFFSQLYGEAKKGTITFDMGSLTSVLTSSYSLEEDDLHKGNFGFYVVSEDAKPHVVFFKIDHDLMLADSVMSRCQTRFFNWFNGPGAFEVTKRDLIHFPALTDSQNYYWPTVRHRILGSNLKAYSSDEELKAFASLAEDPEFKRLKWQEFYKHILIPTDLIVQSLKKHLSFNDPDERAQLSLITQSVTVRQAKLRAVLFSIPEFRGYVSALDDAAHEGMVGRILEDVAGPLSTEIKNTMRWHKQLCGQFDLKDTPLHAAIRLQDYRYQDTWQAFGQYATIKNAGHQTPLELAASLRMAGTPEREGDPRSNLACAIKHMVRSGANTASAVYNHYLNSSTLCPNPNLNDYLYAAPCIKLVDEACDVQQLKIILRDLGEDHRYSLKMQKELSVICVRRFINHYTEYRVHCAKDKMALRNMLMALKDDINGTSNQPPSADLQYIRQLRSELWIVRVIRGLLGGTATQVQLNGLLDKAIKQLAPPTVHACSFFSRSRPSIPSDNHAPHAHMAR